MSRIVRTIGWAASILVLSAPAALAQSNDEVFPQFQWNFATPGARANAMGRSFIGVADDASATITNPAGLMHLTKRQAYFEFKNTDVRVTRLNTPKGFFTPFPSTTASADLSLPAFASASAPVGSRYALAITRHEFLNYRETFSLTPRIVPPPTATGVLSTFAVEGSSHFKGTTYAVSAAMNVNDRTQVGITIGLDFLQASSLATRFGVAQGPNFAADHFDVVTRTVGSPAAPLVINQTSIDDHDLGVSFIAGGLFKVNDMVTVGAEYSVGSRMAVNENVQANPNAKNLSSDTNDPLATLPGFPKLVPINVPNRFGAGASFRPTSRLMAAFDVVRIGYSSLAKNFVIVLDSGKVSGSQFTIANVVEIHAGGEYLLVQGKRPIFIRGGVFTAPDHATRFTGVASPADLDTQAIGLAVYNLLPRSTKVFGSVGVGIVFGERAQLDIAYVGTREFVASVGARF